MVRANTHHREWSHFEADMFMIEDGAYRFDPKKLKAAHEWCLGSAAEVISNNGHVIVANTFCALWEFERYADILRDAPHCELRIETCTGTWPSVHNIPSEALARMAARFVPHDLFAQQAFRLVHDSK